MNKIKEIIRKEWAEVFKNKFVLFTITFMPLLFTIMPLGMLGTVLKGNDIRDVVNGMPEDLSGFCAGLTEIECGQYIVVTEFTILFLVIPVMIPVMISAYSIVGEKTTRTLEPVLATPITTMELLLGKALAAVIPALIATWVSFTIFATGAYMMTKSDRILEIVTNPDNLTLIFLLAPLLAVAGVSVAVMVSSRANDPRVSEQLSALVILPIMALFFGQLAGWVQFNQELVFWLCLGVLLIDGVLIYFASQLFERETILTRWK